MPKKNEKKIGIRTKKNSFLLASTNPLVLFKYGYPKKISNQGLVKLTTAIKKIKKCIINVVTGQI